MSAGAHVGTVIGTDTYATTITYQEDSGGDATANAALEIDSSSGLVSLTTTVSAGTYNYTVTITDDALPTANIATQVVAFTVSAANSAPVLNDSNVANFTTILEHITDGSNVGQAVSTLLTDGSSSAITDSDVGSLEGIALFEANVESTSKWQYKNGSGAWTDISGVTPTSPLLLSSTDELRYVPSVTNGETGSIGFYAWDQTTGTQYGTASVTSRGAATAFSTALTSVSITVSDVNDQPSLISGDTVSLTAINEGQTTSGIVLNTELTSKITDVDTDSTFNNLGIAVVAMSETDAGSWEYSTDAGVNWSNFSDLSSPLNEANAFLIDASNTQGQIRFVSNQDNGETATLNFFAWDQSSGTAGTQVDITATYSDVDSAYSTLDGSDSINGANQFTLTVNSLNDAPELAGITTVLGTISEDDGDSSANNVTTFLLSTQLSSLITDDDTGNSLGIAVIGVSMSNG
jgi:hypothetical protein